MTSHLNPKQKFKLSIDKILFIIACSYLTMVILWLVSQDKLKLPGMANSSNQQLAQQQTLSLEDARFIAYLQQSLEILERKQQQQKATSKPTPTQIVKVPTSPLPSNPPSKTVAPTRIIERIYVPVYPQTQPPSVAASPSVVAVKPSTSTQLIPPPPPPIPSKAKIQPPKPPSTVPVLTPEVSILPEAPPVTSSGNDTGTLLVGLLEAGEQSSALFTINGQTRRVQLGEGIGTTGWMLKSVVNQQVTITRNGAVRSLGIGQNF